jgi:hypothetical protein
VSGQAPIWWESSAKKTQPSHTTNSICTLKRNRDNHAMKNKAKVYMGNGNFLWDFRCRGSFFKKLFESKRNLIIHHQIEHFVELLLKCVATMICCVRINKIFHNKYKTLKVMKNKIYKNYHMILATFIESNLLLNKSASDKIAFNVSTIKCIFHAFLISNLFPLCCTFVSQMEMGGKKS